MLTYLVTTADVYRSFSKVKVVNTLSTLDYKDVEAVIFNTSTDFILDTVMTLATLKDRGIKCIYIAEEINPLIYSIVNGQNGVIVADVTVLQDEDILLFIAEAYHDSGLESKNPQQNYELLASSLSVIFESSNYEQKKTQLENSLWKTTLNSVVSEISTSLLRAEKADIALVNLVENLNSLLSKNKKQQAEMSQTIEGLNSSVADLSEQMRNVQSQGYRSNMTAIFTAYPVPALFSKILYIKEYGNCKFLYSFISAYQHYLKAKKTKKSKILIIQQKNSWNMDKYTEISKLSVDNVSLVSEADSCYATFEPKKAVFDKFFSMSTDVFIVIDSAQGVDLLTGAVRKLNAVSCVSDIERKSFNAKNCICSINVVPEAVSIPVLKDYSATKNDQGRLALYSKGCMSEYEKLDILLDL